jgi:hypothetical protein
MDNLNKTSSGLSYVFSNVKPGSVNTLKDNTISLSESIDKLSIYEKKTDKILLKTEYETNDDSFVFGPRLRNGLIGTILTAYSHHIPLKLRPDDLWIAIMIAFGLYVTKHAEEMRHIFVDHEGKKQLIVRATDEGFPFNVPKELWEKCIDRMCDQIKLNTKDDIVQWTKPDFSTTTQTDIVVSNLIMMATTKEYFDFNFQFDCGLSKITLDGTLDDWIKLKEKANGLYKFNIKDLNSWADLLIIVLDQFIQLYKCMAGNETLDKVNEDFWQRICTFEYRGSGDQETYRGWFLVFTPFNGAGKYILRDADLIKKDNIYAIIDDDNIVSCSIDVKVLVENMFEQQFDCVFYTGLIASRYEDNSLSPASGYVMFLKQPPTYETLITELNTLLDEPYNRRLKTLVRDRFTTEQITIMTELTKFTFDMIKQINLPIKHWIYIISYIPFFINSEYFNKKDDVVTTKLVLKSYMQYLQTRKVHGYTDFNLKLLINLENTTQIVNNYNL